MLREWTEADVRTAGREISPFANVFTFSRAEISLPKRERPGS